MEWEEEEEEEEELLLVVALLVKGVVEGVGVSTTFCFFALSFEAPMSHLRTHASSSSGMWNGSMGMGSLKVRSHTIQPNRACALGAIQNWPTSGQNCYITPAFSGIPK